MAGVSWGYLWGWRGSQCALVARVADLVEGWRERSKRWVEQVLEPVTESSAMWCVVGLVESWAQTDPSGGRGFGWWR